MVVQYKKLDSQPRYLGFESNFSRLAFGSEKARSTIFSPYPARCQMSTRIWAVEDTRLPNRDIWGSSPILADWHLVRKRLVALFSRLTLPGVK
ncbi:hypothetical protein ElyMa_002068900 [Elysia marginata]|uniref:Uncharacterized protein n=1 Tax=Elysia marginata TaxID=1093978 RepID=A0AAV4FBG0_9GAST|nr:hypothetical protein ElyMa_002068900 [Elysia marginata]